MRHRIVLKIEFDREEDGRWIAEASGVPGVAGICVYGASQEEALHEVLALAFEVIADRIKHGELQPADVELAGV